MRGWLGGRPRGALAVGAALAGLLVAALAGGLLVAQVGGDRGIAPVATSSDIDVRGILVNVSGDSPQDARAKGWIEAQKIAWERIGGLPLPDPRLQSLVAAIVVEDERIGPRRYVARLGVIFDRQRAGPLLGGGGRGARSAPMLLLPVMIAGGTQTMFEYRNPWQRAWAEHQFGTSPIDYVRPAGAGGESLLLTYGQTGRRSRVWWNTVLDQFDASDVLVPIANLRHEWPGGPIEGRFTALYGPDSRLLGQFTLRAPGDAQLPAMLTRAVEQFDRIYANALNAGALRPDPTLDFDTLELAPEVRALIDAAQAAEAAELAQAQAQAQAAASAALAPSAALPRPTVEGAMLALYTMQVATPDARAFDAALGEVRALSGVSAATVTSTAIGGTSVLRVSYAGELAALAAQLRARGWQVIEGPGALAISR